MYLKLLAILVALGLCVNSFAQQDEAESVRQALEPFFGEMQIDRIEPSEIPGLYMVLIGAEVFYVSGDGKYLLNGDIIELNKRNNLSELQRAEARVALLDKVPESEFIEFAPESKPEHVVYVFTDISCGYCKQLQNEITEINKRGIAVRYLAYLNQGPDTVIAKNTESIWCAKDRKQAFIDAMAGRAVKPVDCENPVNRHHELGAAMGVSGTPGIFTEDGRFIRGYLPPDRLLQAVRNQP